MAFFVFILFGIYWVPYLTFVEFFGFVCQYFSSDLGNFITILKNVLISFLLLGDIYLCICMCICISISVLGCFLSSYREGNGNPLQYSCSKIPWTEEPGGLHTVHESQRVRHDQVTTTHTHTHTHTQASLILFLFSSFFSGFFRFDICWPLCSLILSFAIFNVLLNLSIKVSISVGLYFKVLEFGGRVSQFLFLH